MRHGDGSGKQWRQGAHDGLAVVHVSSGSKSPAAGVPASTSRELSPSSKLDIRDPIDSIGSHLDAPIQFEVMLLKLMADPTDLGAPARRVVEVAALSSEGIRSALAHRQGASAQRSTGMPAFPCPPGFE